MFREELHVITDIDILLGEKFIPRNIALFQMKENLKTLDEISGEFSREILSRHFHTLIFFGIYCITPMSNILTENEIIEGSTDFAILTCMISGYSNGAGSKDLWNKERPHRNALLRDQIRELFTETELCTIAAFVKKMIINLENEFRDCLEWIRKHQEPEAKQSKVAMEFVAAIKQGRDQESAADKFLKECFHTDYGIHSLWRIEALERNGFLSPPKAFYANIGRILNCLDVLHYAGWLNSSRKLDPQAILFKDFGI